MIRLLTLMGARWRASYPGQLAGLGFGAAACAVLPGGNRRQSMQQLISQVYFTGVEAVPLVFFLAVVIGGATILQAAAVMPKIGAGDALGSVMVLVVLREIGPLFTAFMVAGRTGSALATFLGNMKVQSEIDALRTMGIDPVRFLVYPALVATVFSVFALTILFNFTSLFGGYAIVSAFGLISPSAWDMQLSLGQFLDKVLAAMNPMDAVWMAGKPVCFGILIAVIACFHGLAVDNDMRQVPKATTRSVVNAFASVIVVDFFFAVFFGTRLDFF